jgi:hypothetical protein
MLEKIANHDFGTFLAQRCTPRVLLVDERANGMSTFEKISNRMDARFSSGTRDEVLMLLHGGFSNVHCGCICTQKVKGSDGCKISGNA